MESYLEFQRYGIGQEKLYKLQLRKLMDEGKLTDTPELREFIASDSDEEICDELVKVKLNNFEDLGKLATNSGMTDDYVLHYQPDSVHTFMDIGLCYVSFILRPVKSRCIDCICSRHSICRIWTRD